MVDHLHLGLLPYLPLWSCTQLPRRRCCCLQQQIPLLHTLSRGCEKEGRETRWTQANAHAELTWITVSLFCLSQLPVLQRKSIPWQTVECWILGWVHSFLKQAISSSPTAGWVMLALRLTCTLILHLILKLFRFFCFSLWDRFWHVTNS